MSAIVAILLATAPGPVEIPPATELALGVAEAVGATVDTLALEADATVSAKERSALVDALGRTKLFRIVAPSAAVAILRVTRIDPSIILMTVERPGGERMWVGKVTWPSARQTVGSLPEAGAEPAGEARTDDSERTYRKVLRYRRESLRLAPVRRTSSPSPIIIGGFRSRGFYSPAFWGFGMGHGGTVGSVTDWVVLRGKAEVIDDLDLARLLEDKALQSRIEEERFWPRLWWVTGFGAAAAVGVGAGIWLYRSDERDTRTVGVSLITLGAVSGVLALLFPSVGARHVLEPGETERLCDDYNATLRGTLGLRPEQVERFEPSPQP